MIITEQHRRDLITELEFQYARSSGPGGQHVNKTESKVELRFHVQRSQFLSEENKTSILKKLSNKINLEGYLVLTSQESRSQFKNKEIVIDKFIELLNGALKRKVRRVPTRPSLSSVKKRIEGKKQVSVKKKMRKFVPED